MGAKIGKYKFGPGMANTNLRTRAGKYKLGARAGKHKLGARTDKYKLGTKTGK